MQQRLMKVVVVVVVLGFVAAREGVKEREIRKKRMSRGVDEGFFMFGVC